MLLGSYKRKAIIKKGNKFNKLTAIKFNYIGKNYLKYWTFKCECGKEKTICVGSVKSGQTKSCGCSNKRRTTDGMSRTDIYKKLAYQKRKDEGKIREYAKNWRNKNREKYRKTSRIWQKEYGKTLKGNLNRRMSSGIWFSLRKNKNGRKWESLVGYTVNDLKLHIEKLFTIDMDWDKLLKGEIEIDHIKPKSLFDF